jgi:hypothetical protein
MNWPKIVSIFPTSGLESSQLNPSHKFFLLMPHHVINHFATTEIMSDGLMLESCPREAWTSN